MVPYHMMVPYHNKVLLNISCKSQNQHFRTPKTWLFSPSPSRGRHISQRSAQSATPRASSKCLTRSFAVGLRQGASGLFGTNKTP